MPGVLKRGLHGISEVEADDDLGRIVAGDYRVAAHSATGLQDSHAREIFQTSRLKPRPQARDLFVIIKLAKPVPFKSESGCNDSHAPANGRKGREANAERPARADSGASRSSTGASLP